MEVALQSFFLCMESQTMMDNKGQKAPGRRKAGEEKDGN